MGAMDSRRKFLDTIQGIFERLEIFCEQKGNDFLSQAQWTRQDSLG